MPKKIPMRQCLGCREMKPKRELLRVVRSPEGAVSLDLRGKASGRGAYVCPNTDCIKTRALSRAFETEIPQDVYDALLQEMEAANGT